MLRRAMRPGTVRLDPDDLRGAHPDSFDLVNTTPRLADDAVRPDAEAWQIEAEAYVRERRGSLVIEADFTSAADFRLSAHRFARAGYRIEVVVLAGREADTRQATLVRHVRALELDVITALPTPAAHARACRTVGDITVAAANDPSIATVLVLDAGHQALGRDRWAPRALAGARNRPYTEQEAARFRTVQRTLHQVLLHLRREAAGLTAQAQHLMPHPWRARPVEYSSEVRRLPAAGRLVSSPAVP
ncbi:hypothetical protein Slala03_81160 [Streptomyces lavendulae subsp. lavendulae]|nr:hypothetical protein Slala03_81160 [Streptomyces lavendulae subsp. lavendulae]